MSEDSPEALPSTSPRVVTYAALAFLLVVGLPAALFLYAGRTEVALGLLAVFVLMVLVTAYALRKATEAQDDAES